MAGGARSWAQRALMAFSGVLVVGGVLSLTTVAYGVYRVENLPTEAVRDLLAPRGPVADPPPGVPRAPNPLGAPFNVLLVGDSSRDFVESDVDRESFGADEGRGSDSIVLVRVDPMLGTAATLPIPRDLWVELGDGSGPARINTAYEDGGARLLLQTVTARLAVPINHYVALDFDGFRELVDAVDGITLAIEHPARDFNRATGRNESGLDLRTAGCVTLDGAAALAYVRSRHFEQLIDGVWVPDGRNDFGRSERQQQFLRQVLAKAMTDGLLDPRRVLDLLDVADRSLTVSDDLDADRIAGLVRDVSRLSPEAFTDYALPVADLVTPAGAQVLELLADEAGPVLDVFRGVVPPATVVEDDPAPADAPAEEPPDVSTTTVPPAPLC